jgi:hypothetical protein
VSVGAFVASRVPTNPIGWLLMTIGIAFLIGISATEYAVYALFTNPGGLPHPYAAAWISNWTALIAGGAALLLVALFPNGSAASPRWRWLPPAIVVDIVLGIVVTTLRVGPIDLSDVGPDPLNPTGIEALEPIVGPIGSVFGFATIALAIAALVSLVLRYRASRGDERQQIRWLAYVGFLMLSLLILIILSSIGLGGRGDFDAERRAVRRVLHRVRDRHPQRGGDRGHAVPPVGPRRHPEEGDRRDGARDLPHDRLAGDPDRRRRGRRGAAVRIARRRPRGGDRRRGASLAAPPALASPTASSTAGARRRTRC